MNKILFILVLSMGLILRIYQFGSNPPSLYWDEASLGYNAYSVATSGKDEHGEFLPLARFAAFGDYKPPGYIYAAAIPILMGGLNEFTVRFPSLIAGLAMVIFTYLLVKELFHKEKIAILSAFIIGISPWAIHFSRAAFEANLAAFFNLAGIYFFILALRKKPLIILSVIMFILSFYTFNANRIIAPLLLIVLALIFFKDMLSNWKWITVSVFTGIILVLPSISFLSSSESRLRFQEVSIFNNLEPLRMSNMLIARESGSLLSKMIHNRRVVYSLDFLKHYSDNFSLRFLFTYGDVNPRLAISEMGELYVYELPFLIIGFYLLVKKREKALLPLVAWLLIAPIPAGTAKETPHALRIISILPSFQIIIAYGLYYSSSRIFNMVNKGKRYILAFTMCLIISVSIFYYLHNYYNHYPYNWSGEWQYGYKEMVSYVLYNERNYDEIYVTNSLGRPYIYFAFYKPFSEEDFIKSRVAFKDSFGFWDVRSLGKIRFDLALLPNARGRVLLVTTENKLPPGYRLVKEIRNLRGDEVFKIADKT